MVNGVIGIGPGVGSQWAFADDPRTCAYDKLSANGPVVALAQWNLAHSFTFVGDTGRFAESVWLLQRTFGWGEPMALSALSRSARNFHRGGRPRRGYTPWKVSDLPFDFVQNEFVAAEACDVALYAYARELVASRLANMPSHNVPALKRFLAQAIAQDQAQVATSASTGHPVPRHSGNITKEERTKRGSENDVPVPFKKHQKELIREKRKHQKAGSSNSSAASTSDNTESTTSSRILWESTPVHADHTSYRHVHRSLLKTTAVVPRIAFDDTEAIERTGFNATAWRMWLATEYHEKAVNTKPAESSSSTRQSGMSRNNDVNGSASSELAAAHQWWLDVVQKASKASPPRANKATLVFLHVPKTVDVYVI